MEDRAQSGSQVLLERVSLNGAAWAEVILNRPEKGNALTMAMLERLGSIAEEIGRDREIRVVVLRGRGRFFCTGGDIAAWGAMTPHEMAQRWILPGIEVFQRLASLPQPVIAVLQGHVFGGGMELAMAADLRIAARGVKLGVPEVSLGMIPGWMGVRRLAETIGVARASHMALLGTPVTAEQALDWGLVTAVAEDEADLESQAAAWRERLCANAPAAMGLVKGLLATMRADLRHHHANAVAEAAGTEDCAEGVRAFREKRAAEFRGR
ncbi:MAG: enoyl-CoA hydratase/isomerase family protein [Bryobacteraceae bacterium]|nr:enoyl-CoA hydratase/isomerase family protein [Bryobacteraceae bacterium]